MRTICDGSRSAGRSCSVPWAFPIGRSKDGAPFSRSPRPTVETTVDPKVRGGMKFDYRLLVEGDERLCATGYTRHACVGADGRVSRPPAFLMEAVRELLIED
jgi:hypothetical protein